MATVTPSIEAQRALVACWAEAGAAMATERRRALASRPDHEWRAAALDLLQLADRLEPYPARERTSGFVAMQDLFARGRR